MNKKAILFSLIILIAFLTLFSFVNRWAYISNQYDEVDLIEHEFLHVYHLQNDMSSTYLQFLNIDEIIFSRNSTHTKTNMVGNMSLQDSSSFLTSMYSFYTNELAQKSPVFSVSSPLSSELYFEPQGYVLDVDQNTALLSWDEVTTLQSISLTLFFNATIDSLSDSQTSDASTNPVINITIYDENGYYGNYVDTLDPSQDNGDMTFSSLSTDLEVSFGLYGGSDGVLRVNRNAVSEEVYIRNLQIVSPAFGESYVGAFNVSYDGEYISYDGNLKLGYE